MQFPFLSITYKLPVELGSGNISIFEVNEENPRQKFNGTNKGYLIIENDKKIRINIFGSTFNKPNQLYHAVVEDGFVNHKNTEEPLLGFAFYFRTGMD